MTYFLAYILASFIIAPIVGRSIKNSQVVGLVSPERSDATMGLRSKSRD